MFEPGQAKLIPAGSDIVLEVHYMPEGKATTDQANVGLVLAKEAPTERVMTLSTGNEKFKIPPGDPDYRVDASFTFRREVTLLGMHPHMHMRGKDMYYRVVFPNGETRALLNVPHYNWHWQLWYNLAKPMVLPAGSRIECTAHYAVLAATIAPHASVAQSVVATVAVGTTPIAVAANPVTHKVYVVNHGSNSVTIVDGASHAASTVSVEDRPEAVAINPKTSKIYITDAGADSVSVIDGGTDKVSATVHVGSYPQALVVDTVRNKIYVANNFGHSVTLSTGQPMRPPRSRWDRVPVALL